MRGKLFEETHPRRVTNVTNAMSQQIKRDCACEIRMPNLGPAESGITMRTWLSLSNAPAGVMWNVDPMGNFSHGVISEYI